MTDRKHPDTDLPASESNTPDTQTAETPSRRRFLTGVAAIGASAGGLAVLPPASAAQDKHLEGNALTQALRKNVKTVVVIYAENRSFNNLFGNFPGVQSPLSAVKADVYTQRDRDGSVLKELPPVWDGLVAPALPATADKPAVPQHVNHKDYIVKQDAPYMNHLPNAPFVLRGPDGEHLPLGVVTHDLWHVFYQNQMQINGGKNDNFVAWADSGGQVMGHYGNTSYELHLWSLAQQYTLCDNYFQGAFGGSFLNHQYLVSATVPSYPDVHNSPARTQIASVEGDDPKGTRLKPLASSPASALQGAPKFGPSALTPDGFAVNTMAPPYWPSWTRDAKDPAMADLSQPMTLVPQSGEHIGDRVEARGLQWAWYAGGWQWAIDNKPNSKEIPKVPNFQHHHQPLNYFENLGPKHPERREMRLRDAGLGDEPETNKFLADARDGKLPAVTFYKPQGNLNMHAGYADVASGDAHISHIVHCLQQSPQWKNMVVVVTVDENGGWWDHVAPPKGDRWGPGTRVPALVISPFAKRGFVDHTQYDTGSIQRLINRVFDLKPLPGLHERDAALRANGHAPMGDLTNALNLKA